MKNRTLILEKDSLLYIIYKELYGNIIVNNLKFRVKVFNKRKNLFLLIVIFIL